MALSTIAGFNVGGTEPIDIRLVLTKAEMLAFDDSLMPSDYFCMCSDDHKMYQYNKNNTVNPVTGKFRVFEGGGYDLNLPKTINQNWQGNGYNLIPYPYYDGMSKTYNGITYTVNPDGSITVNGTAIDTSSFTMRSRTYENWKIPSGTYRLSGCPMVSESFNMNIGRTDGSSYSSIGIDTGNGIIVEIGDNFEHLETQIYISNGATVSNLTFYPMLVKVSDDGSYPTEYQRYAMGNVELTDKFNSVYIGQGNGYLASGKTYILRDRPYNIIDSRFFKVIISANQSYDSEVFAYEYFGVIHYTPHEGVDYRGVTTEIVSHVGVSPNPSNFSVEFGYDEGGIYVLNNGIITAYMTVIAKKEDLLI